MEELAKHIFGEESLASTVAFVHFTLMGMLLVKIWRFNLKKKRMLRQKPPMFLNFNFKIWVNDNLLDFICALNLALIVYRFFPDTLEFINKYFTNLPEFSDKMFYGLLLGFAFQYVMHKMMSKIKIVNNE